MNKYLLIKIASVVIAVISQLLLKKSANIKYNNIVKEYLNKYVIVAYVIFAISVVLSIVSLRGISIGFSAIIEALNYIIIPLLGVVLLNEKLHRKQILGIALIVIGMIVFNL